MEDLFEKNETWKYFENIYDNTIRKGQTFSYDMGEIIQKELEKMKKERDKWLKKNKKELDK